jgi:FkbM family methyltransferase
LKNSRPLKQSLVKKFKHGISGLGNQFFSHARSVFRRVFHWLVQRLGMRRFREHSFFAALLSRSAVVGDFGAHHGEFFIALKSEYSISRALLVEANPALAECLKEKLWKQADVLQAALVGGDHNDGSVMFTRSIESESSSVFRQWAAAYGIVDQVEVATTDFAEALRRLGGWADLVKLDIEGAEVPILQSASASDLTSCRQLTVEFHDKRPPFAHCDVASVCRRMRSEGYGIVYANWPKMDDVLFVNLKSMSAPKRMEFRCRMALANALFVVRRVIFASGYS